MADGSFSFEAQRTLVSAFSAAREFSHSCLCSEHLLLGICAQRGEASAAALERQGITMAVLEREILALNGRGETSVYTAEISREAGDVLESAAKMACLSDTGKITPNHILLAILRNGECSANKLLVSIGIDIAAVTRVISLPPQASPVKRSRLKEMKLLNQYGEDMTQKAASGGYDRLVGREKELERVMRILCRRRKANPVLLGEAGVGKSAIAEGLAAAIAAGKAPPPLRGMKVISIDMGTMVSGTKYRGEFEEKIRGIIDEACSCGNVILFIDEIHTVSGAGAAEGAIDAGNILKPALARGDIRVLGATTPAEYRKYIGKDAALERRFQPVDVDEPDRERTLAILRSSASLCRRYYGVEAGEDILCNIELMCRRFMPQRYFPDKAIDVLDEASAMALTEGKRELNEGHIRRVVSQMSGLTLISEGHEFISPNLLEENLKAQVAGQDKAVDEVVAAVSAAMAFPGVRNRPQGVMMFCGASGTGKTYLAKCLARELFGDEKALVRFDMSEYREAHSISRMIGAPPGYHGHGNGGLLTEAIRRRPFSVLLFDEVEKAHPEVLNLLLQLLEDGVLTDSEGKTADFKSAIIIMTSNIGNKVFSGRTMGFGGGSGVDLKNALSQSFTPELLNRIDRFVLFDELTPDALREIALSGIRKFAERLLEEGIEMSWDDNVPAAVAHGTRDGRGVRVNITRMVEEPLAIISLGMGRPRFIHLYESEGKVEIKVGDHPILSELY